MVRIEEITKMVDKDLDDFYRDRDRFKGMKAIIGFSSAEYDHKAPKIDIEEPKFKKKLKVSKFIKKKNKGKGLF
jgi:hypothetical protein